MPTYEYKCSECGEIFEYFQNITDKPLKKCVKCKSSKVKRLIGTGSGIIFKGKGFYQTDYKGGSSTEKKTPPCGESGTCPGCKENA